MKKVEKDLFVLVVEDDSDMRELLKEVLVDAGCCVITAADVENGLHMLENFQFCLVVTDLHLPDGNGNDILRYVRENLENLPVILCTGMELLPSKNHQGFDDYLVKPVHPQLLTDTVCACMDTTYENKKGSKVA